MSITIATWVLAIATVPLAIEGGTALLAWTERLRPGRTKRELAALQREVELLHHAIWIDVATADQGTRSDIDERVTTQLAGRCSSQAFLERG